MILTSRDGASLILRPVAYQFTACTGPGPAATDWLEEWDPNWLMVRGDARTSDGWSWTFVEPCLTTWEARELGDWLGQVAADGVKPANSGDEDAALLEFTEPNLAFLLEARQGGDLRLRVQLSAEALPPWKFRAGQADIFDQFLTFDMSDDDIRAARGAWEEELLDFPER